MLKNLLRISSLIILSLLLMQPAAFGERFRVVVSVLPYVPIVKAIGGEAVEVQALQSEGNSCSLLDLRPQTVVTISKADLYFRCGAGLEESLVARLDDLNPSLQVLDLREGLRLRRYVIEAPDEENGEGHDDHVQVFWDPHHWLDPVLVRAQAKLIAATLIELLPEQKDDIEGNLERFDQALSQRINRLEKKMEPFRGRAFFVYHPSLGYFADRFGLEQIAMESGTQQVDLRAMREWTRKAREFKVKTIFIQPQESKIQAETIARAIGARIVEIDPLGIPWGDNLEAIADQLIAGWKEPGQ